MSTASNTSSMAYWTAVMAAEDSAVRVQARFQADGSQDISEAGGGEEEAPVTCPPEGRVGLSNGISPQRVGLGLMSTETTRINRFPTERRQAHRLVPLAELQERFGYSERWWRYRIKDGMPRHKWGSRLRFSPTEVEAWLDERYGDAAKTG